MPEKFEVGEVALFCKPGSPYFGAEVAIISELVYCPRMYSHTDQTWSDGWAYRVTGDLPDLKPPGCSFSPPWYARPEHLQKKRPPREPLGRWDQCPWQPEVVRLEQQRVEKGKNPTTSKNQETPLYSRET